MSAELVETVVVEVLDTSGGSVWTGAGGGRDIHACRTPGHLAALLHAVQLAAAVGLGLAHHVVIVVGLAARTDEVRGGKQRCRAGAELFDFGDVVGQRGGVDEGLLVEPGHN